MLAGRMAAVKLRQSSLEIPDVTAFVTRPQLSHVKGERNKKHIETNAKKWQIPPKFPASTILPKSRSDLSKKMIFEKTWLTNDFTLSETNIAPENG